jgi:hypothetical protein
LVSFVDGAQFVVEGLILVFVLYMAFAKSYVEKKGENLATKEDVQEITSLMESVKSRVEYSLQAKLSLRAEEHNALVDYFAKYYAWLSALLNCTLPTVKYDDPTLLDQIRQQMETAQLEFGPAIGRMELFVDNAEILAQHSELYIETLKFHGALVTETFAMDKLHVDTKHAERVTPQAEWPQKYRDFAERRLELYRTFQANKVEGYRTLLPFVMRQRSTISVHLRKLAEMQD